MAQGVHHRHRHVVVGDEHRVGLCGRGEQSPRRVRRLVAVEIADLAGAEFDAVLGQPVDEAAFAVALRRRALPAGDVGDAPVPAGDQEPRELPAAGDVVGGHRREPRVVLEPVEQLCRSLLNMSRFPSYVFIARRAGHVYPAYTVEEEVVITTTGGGPVFRHVELARVHHYLTEYLHQIKILGKDGRSDKRRVAQRGRRARPLQHPHDRDAEERAEEADHDGHEW